VKRADVFHALSAAVGIFLWTLEVGYTVAACEDLPTSEELGIRGGILSMVIGRESLVDWFGSTITR
jgi:hypothetical protein